VNVVIAVDTSGSITDEEMREFVSEVDTLKSQVNARVLLHACDERLDEHGPWTFEPWEAFSLPASLCGGGGTDFRPVFEWVERDRIHPDVLVYFTDAEGEFPSAAPQYPVIWLVKGKGKVPFGERIALA
jgi:predicted metal-dependent peptidase